MKTIIIQILLFCLSLHSSDATLSPFICPVDDQQRPINGVFKDSILCDTYHHCINGTAFLRKCPPGQHFKIILSDCSFSACVDPELSDCSETLKASLPSQKIRQCETGEKNSNNGEQCFTRVSECSSNSNETVPSFLDCRIYYHCRNGVSWPQQCPDGYYYSLNVNTRECKAEMCVPFEVARCPLAGGWSAWSQWGDCEPECGGFGIETRRRECNNPPPQNGGAECPGVPIEIRECKPPDCSGSTSPAFMLSLQENTNVNNGKIPWSSIDVNDDNLYNSNKKEVEIKKPGMYFFSMTATTLTNTWMSLENTGINIGLSKEIHFSDRLLTETITRSGLFSLSSLFKPRVVHLLNDSNLIGSNDGKDTSWLGFRYESNSFVSAALGVKQNSPGFLSLNTIFLNRGFTISNNNKIFTSREAGLYYINFGSGIEEGNSEHNIILSVARYMASYTRIYSKPPGIVNRQSAYPSSRGFLQDLHENTVLQLSASNHVTSSKLETYLLAFKINSSFPAVFLVKSHQGQSQCRPIFGIQGLQFENVLVDTLNSWNTTGYFTAPIDAAYFVEVNLVAIRTTELIVEVNDQVAFKLKHVMKHSGEAELSTRTALLRLKEGDICKIKYRGCLEHMTMSSSFTIFAIQN
ncbi:DgyrCDS14767 [Dimorphilus gyrociliatus]|uniref:DgyrCDS14767 n=1 Tax=Dimorphilus gyrociliatus TaxID=2664684 RepID=A0A7I8WEX5_9ANNE|nr:DgyrCDS14767 [Dimorphilus gyrociliatus]